MTRNAIVHGSNDNNFKLQVKLYSSLCGLFSQLYQPQFVSRLHGIAPLETVCFRVIGPEVVTPNTEICAIEVTNNSEKAC